jgi:hypothetical protein
MPPLLPVCIFCCFGTSASVVESSYDLLNFLEGFGGTKYGIEENSAS